MSIAITKGVRVEVESQYVPERSEPTLGNYFFAYRVHLTNEGNQTVQLMSRHWVITDAEGKVEEVRGPGVIGEQPILEPGESFEYTSFCPLATPRGVMQGAYQMVTRNGVQFEAAIAPFSLHSGELLH